MSAGTGKIHELIESKQVTLLDISSEMLSQAKKRLTNTGSIRYVQADAHNMPLEDTQFDTVLCVNSLQHFDNPKQVLSEIHRVLKNDAELILVAWTKQGTISELLYWILDKTPGIHYIETPKNTIKLIQEEGFHIRNTTSWNFRWWGLTCIHAKKLQTNTPP